MTHRFYIVDVFAEQAYAGNPLAVVLDADDLSIETMQRVAAETNYSETTFVMSAPEADGGYRVRLFTPAREIDFAGHPILGTAWVVRHHVAPRDAAPVRLNLAVGQVQVCFDSEVVGTVAWFRSPPVVLGPTCAPERIAAALGLAVEDIDTRAPVQRVSAGTAVMIVPLRSLDALGRARLDLAAYAPLVAEGLPPLTYLFTTQTRQAGNDLSARFFSRPTACARTRPPAMARPSSGPGCWSTATSRQRNCRCASSRGTRCSGLRWCGCARAPGTLGARSR